MLAKTYSATMVGLTPIKIEIEVDATTGIPNLLMIGLPGKSVEEARERITSALLNCDIKLRAKRTVVNLAPADLKKTGSAFELAIAVALLKLYEEIEGNFEEAIFLGELALDGSLRGIRGALPLIIAAKEMGFKKVFVPRENFEEVRVVKGIDIFLVENLREFIGWCHGLEKLKRVSDLNKSEKESGALVRNEMTEIEVDFLDINGQAAAKRCLEIAAAGGHNLLMLGPPGSGKTLLAQALVGIMPPLTEPEMIEVTKVYSICGLNKDGLVKRRPFRSPHHTISSVGMVGGGQNLRPGEISLAHRGVLFLDELLEFPRSVLEALRQPLEDGIISVTRAMGRAEFPARLTLVAAANPCPCGYFGSNQKPCQCGPGVREAYQQKLSGPILDRIDQILRVSEVAIDDLSWREKDATAEQGESSAAVRARVIKAREKQRARFRESNYVTNSEIRSKDLKNFCKLEETAEKLLQQAAVRYGFSARSYFKIIKIAQTIADLADQEKITVAAIAEAVQYRLGY